MLRNAPESPARVAPIMTARKRTLSTLIPTASAASGFSPVAFVMLPYRVLFKRYQKAPAITIVRGTKYERGLQGVDISGTPQTEHFANDHWTPHTARIAKGTKPSAKSL